VNRSKCELRETVKVAEGKFQGRNRVSRPGKVHYLETWEVTRIVYFTLLQVKVALHYK